MLTADYRSGTPLLPTMLFPGKNNMKWSWLIVLCLGAGWGAPRQPWDDGGHHDLKVVWHLVFLLVFCVLFYADAIAFIAENRLRSIINDNSLEFGLARSLLV
jgi:hypothetical protein